MPVRGTASKSGPRGSAGAGRGRANRPPASTVSRRRWSIRVTIGLGTILALDQLAGLLLIRDGRFRGRPVPPYPALFNEAQRQALAQLTGEAPDPYFRFDPALGWDIRPGGRSADGLYRANAAGFRADREYALHPPEGVLRIAAFGDSFTHCTTPGEDTWEAIIERQDPGIEVLNFGVNGYGLDQAYLRFQRDGSPFHPDVVLIGVMRENLLRSISAYRPAYVHETKSAALKPRFRLDEGGGLELIAVPARDLHEFRALVDSEHLYDRIRHTDGWIARAPLAYRDSWLWRSPAARLLYGAYENAGRDPRAYYDDPRSEPYRLTLSIIKAFHAEALSRGARGAIVLFFPDETGLWERMEASPAYWEGFLGELERARIPVLDLSPTFLDAFRKLHIRWFFEHEHYSALGNELVADRVLAGIQRLLPDVRDGWN